MDADRTWLATPAPGASGRGGSHLGMQLGATRWLLELEDVSEVIPVPALRRVPLTKPWFCGIANVHGNLVGVVDFGAFLGAPLAPNDANRLVLVADRHRINSGLLFGPVTGLRELAEFACQPDAAPPATWVAGIYADADQQRWHALDMHALMTHPDFLQIERQAG